MRRRLFILGCLWFFLSGINLGKNIFFTHPSTSSTKQATIVSVILFPFSQLDTRLLPRRMREKKKQYLLSSHLSESSSSDEEDKIGADRSKYILTEAIEAKIRNQPKSSKTGEHPITTPSKKEKKGKTNKKIAIEDVARRSDAVGEEDINQLLNSSSETEMDTRTQTKRSKKKQVRNKYFSKFYICNFFNFSPTGD